MLPGVPRELLPRFTSRMLDLLLGHCGIALSRDEYDALVARLNEAAHANRPAEPDRASGPAPAPEELPVAAGGC